MPWQPWSNVRAEEGGSQSSDVAANVHRSMQWYVGVNAAKAVAVCVVF
jgi:hypothetical protein